MDDENELIVDFTSTTDRSRLWAVLRVLAGKHRVTIKRYRKRRSNPQNAYYWGVVVPQLARFLRDQGQCYTSEEAHGILKHKFLRVSVCNADGEPIAETTRSTADLSTVQFNEYLELCIAWLADQFNIVCPMPGEAIAA